MSEPSIKELLASSGFAFTGTVEEVAATTVPDLAVDDRTVIVRILEVLHGATELPLPPGSRLTVQLSPELPPLRAGEQAAFFVSGLAYGESLAVSEVGRTTTEEAAGRTARLAGIEAPVSPVRATLVELAQDDVVEHARGADAVVRGQVTALAQAPRSLGRPLSEHDPQYWIATLAIDLVAKGEIPGVTEAGGTALVLYANSIDVHWRESPKPKAGQAGLWLLHATAGEEASLAPFQLLHLMDLQPSTQLNLLRERGI